MTLTEEEVLKRLYSKEEIVEIEREGKRLAEEAIKEAALLLNKDLE